MPKIDLLAHASHYAGRGWPVFPLREHEKRPATQNGFHDATTDPEQVRRWWTERPQANIGIAIPPGVVVIDVDPRNGGTETARELARELGPLPYTRAALTRSGGQHYYLQTYLEPERTRCELGDGVDVKVAGKGYVVAPPSAVEPGAYRWLNQARLSYLPESWAKRLTKSPRVHRPPADPVTDPLVLRDAIRWECRVLSHAVEGRRNPSLYQAARRLAACGCLTADAERRLGEVAEGLGLDGDEIAHVIASARRGAGL